MSSILLAFAAAFAGAALLSRIAPRAGWVDAPLGLERKQQPVPVPAIGGAAVLLGLLAGWALLELSGRDPGRLVPGRGLLPLLGGALGQGAQLFPLGALLSAFAVGLADDLLPGGLRPGAKLLGQAASGAVLGLPLLAGEGGDPATALAAVLLLAAGAVVCTNALNTFDNADGAAASLAAAALLVPAPLLAASVAAFLPFNLRAKRGAPSAYLGDSGSHLLGMLVLLTPAAWPALLLPLLDLARVSVARARAGSLPWVGDRRHLAHRILRRGCARALVPLVLLAIAAPSLCLGWPGALPTALLFVLALGWSRDPGAPARSLLGRRACPPPGRAR